MHGAGRTAVDEDIVGKRINAVIVETGSVRHYSHSYTRHGATSGPRRHLERTTSRAVSALFLR